MVSTQCALGMNPLVELLDMMIGAPYFSYLIELGHVSLKFFIITL